MLRLFAPDVVTEEHHKAIRRMQRSEKQKAANVKESKKNQNAE